MNNKQNGDRFVNPYNFVPLEGKCDKKKRETGNLTGKITCTIETLTPLFIQDNQNKEEFFHYPDDERPVIPGSEIRGTIRSVFEAAFNGCLSQVNDEPFHRRSMEPKKPGLLYMTDEGWKLQECERVMLNTTFSKDKDENKHGKFINSKKLQTGQLIYIKKSESKYRTTNVKARKYVPNVVQDYSFQPKQGFDKGIIYLGEPLEGKKHHESVFIELTSKANKPKSLKEQDINNLKDVVLLYLKNSEQNNKDSKPNDKKPRRKPYNSYLKLLDNATIHHQLPVYYSIDSKGNISHLAPAVFSQEVYQNTLLDILKAQGNYEPCECKEKICPACHLFGFVNEQSMQASRVRFSDATIEKEFAFLGKMTLPVLGQPKPGTVEFYTEKQDSAKYWTYDYIQVGKKREPLKPNNIKIRGRKFYWHHNPKSYSLKTTNKSEMETTIKPLNKGNKFTFTIYFERLSEKELSQLCNVLDINYSTQHAHKIGRGKPLGFGSVRMKINEIKIRQINKKTGAFEVVNKERANFMDVKINQKASLLTILRFPPSFAEHLISYPEVEATSKKEPKNLNKLASHQWFTKNSKNKGQFEKVLPTIEEEVATNASKWLRVIKVGQGKKRT
ncbi:TIGR03986 family type III CRISPR-associated RAMP protein [Virgibacillus proomii]|uniref:TIGR03986 family type III CRISPR-associated RAMP protein n=1 Tax=Virgibacillus proomii TaxID=84407 RepID=UPI001C10A8B9|nr:TIGR03986 family CRISPR-associated RAMP protein [Virgibacillus proomii]MBU5266439.1 TIGR03986 family CRISPR-associated RAMP protein [Virgibacillus proomii]